jgi:hypothetical protein
MNQGKTTAAPNLDIATIIDKWGRETWTKPSKPKTSEERKSKHDKLAQTLRSSGFAPEDIPLKYIEKILQITVPIDNGSENAQQMRGAAYWYLRESFLNPQKNALNSSYKKAA